MKKTIKKGIQLMLAISFLTFVGCMAPAKEETKKEETEKPAPVARVATPQPSPFSKLKQKVGLTDVTVEFSRPAMRGRKIFGDLVPYGKTWRTGANANTKITFSDDITIDSKTLKAGTYAIYSVPNKDSWDIMFYMDSDNWGTPQEWDDAKVALKTTVKTEDMPMTVQSFTITVDDLTNTSASLGILWENTYVAIPFEVPTDAAVMASIEEVMKGEPNASAYYSAAVYFKEANKDVNQALEWIDKSIEMSKEDPKFWMYRQQSLIHAKAGKTETAIAAAKMSLDLAKKAGNDDYVKMNTDSLKEWGAL